MTEELKPCPFCGGPARLVHDLWQLYVQCDWCEARTGYTKAYDEIQAIAATPLAIEDWNKRVEQ